VDLSSQKYAIKLSDALVATIGWNENLSVSSYCNKFFRLSSDCILLFYQVSDFQYCNAIRNHLVYHPRHDGKVVKVGRLFCVKSSPFLFFFLAFGECKLIWKLLVMHCCCLKLKIIKAYYIRNFII
jgi:hypothetical protein